MVDWNAMKTEYITTRTSYRELAQKYGVSHFRVERLGWKEKWTDLRRQHAQKTLTKSLEADTEAKLDRLSRVLNAADDLLDKIEQAITQLDIRLCKEVRKEKVKEYDDKDSRERATREIIREDEILKEVSTIIDRQGLMQIASALRGVKEVQMLRTELDRREQEAKIENLRRMAEKDEGKLQPVEVIMGGNVEKYAE